MCLSCETEVWLSLSHSLSLTHSLFLFLSLSLSLSLLPLSLSSLPLSLLPLTHSLMRAHALCSTQRLISIFQLLRQGRKYSIDGASPDQGTLGESTHSAAAMLASMSTEAFWTRFYQQHASRSRVTTPSPAPPPSSSPSTPSCAHVIPSVPPSDDKAPSILASTVTSPTHEHPSFDWFLSGSKVIPLLLEVLDDLPCQDALDRGEYIC